MSLHNLIMHLFESQLSNLHPLMRAGR